MRDISFSFHFSYQKVFVLISNIRLELCVRCTRTEEMGRRVRYQLKGIKNVVYTGNIFSSFEHLRLSGTNSINE
jgi:hypothetical protein